LKADLGVSAERVVLYVGQFIHRKGLPYLLEAFEVVHNRHPDTALVLVGYGPEQQQLVDIAGRGRGEVHILPHVEVADLPKMYALADIFVLPSLEETWGLVVNEAMACGLPVVVTDRVGAWVDLVHDGANGFVVPAADSPALAERLERLVSDPQLLRQFGDCSARRIERFTPEDAAASFAEAVHYVMHSR
jgi:glycosyltransferase involved in cell wall biosynthesis